MSIRTFLKSTFVPDSRVRVANNATRMPNAKGGTERAPVARTRPAPPPAGAPRRVAVPRVVPPLPLALQDHVFYSRSLGRPFGAVATQLGHLSKAQVLALMDDQDQLRTRRIGEIAIAKRMLSPGQVEEILSEQSGVIYVDTRHRQSPLFLTWLGDVKRLQVEPQISSVDAQRIAELQEERKTSNGNGADEVDLANLNLARSIFTDAGSVGASDVHIRVQEDHAEVQLRVKGELKVLLTLRRDEGESLIRAAYTGLSSVKENYIPHKFQDAQINGDSLPKTNVSSVRLIRGPAHPEESGGGFMVARLQYGEHVDGRIAGARPLDLRAPTAPAGAFNLAERGFAPSQMALFEQLVRLPMGIVAVTGPTGSGKTTTVFELMRYQAQLFVGSRQITVENPPEYPMPWAIQTAWKSERYPEAVAMTLRMDPDIILIGEIRAAGEANAAVHAAMTGHFVWTSVHVTDPYKVITRLEGLDRVGLSKQVVCDHELLVGLVAQRLVPELCPNCRLPLEKHGERLPAFMRDALKTWGDLSKVYLQGPGCVECGGDGVLGKRAVAEIVLTDETLMTDILKLGLGEARRKHRQKPGSDKSMLRYAMELIFQGKLDPRDVQRMVHRIVPHGADL
jgi:type II secretory ATPase GspE/PulE/Tfp pilus assembly ATPase PilB-like protein